MVQISGRWHPKVCDCVTCTTLRAETGVQSVLGAKEGSLTTRELMRRAITAPKGRLSERLKDGRILSVMVGYVQVPGVEKHMRAWWYIDGKRVSRATAALILRNHT